MSRIESIFCTFSLMLLLISANLCADGNVQVTVTNAGDLKVTGANNTPQSLIVTPTSNASEFGFFSFDGTTFNGQATLFVAGVTRNVDFNLKSGEKILILSEGEQSSFFVQGQLKIRSSGSAPAIIIVDTVDVTGRTDIKTGNGEDAVLNFGGSYFDSLKINTANGNDVVLQGDNEIFGNAQVTTGGGNDFVIEFMNGRSSFQLP